MIWLGFALSQHTLHVELVSEALARYFGQYHLIVVVADCAAHFVVVHIGLILAFTPASRHFIWINHPELTRQVLPADEEVVCVVGKKLQNELPELNLTRSH